MAYKLIDAAQARWRKVNGPELVALVPAGAVIHNGKLRERPTGITPAAETKPIAANRGGRLKTPNPQVLTIPRRLDSSTPAGRMIIGVMGFLD
jgi:hypothetical protein